MKKNMNDVQRPVIIADKDLKDYAWTMLLEFEKYHEIKLQMKGRNVSKGLHLAALFGNMGIEYDKPEIVSAMHKNSGNKMLVTEITLRKIPAAKK